MGSLAILGSKPRLEILRLLSRRDLYVSELMDAIGMDGTTATHHLEVLTDAGEVDSYEEGRRRHYRLHPEVRVHISPVPGRGFVALPGRDADHESSGA